MDQAKLELIQDYAHRFEELKADRANWESHWQEISEFISPRKADFVGMRQAGEKRHQKVYDSTGEHSLTISTAGLYGLATNPAAKWFILRTQDDQLNESQPVKLWLQATEQRLWSKMYAPGSKFGTSLTEIYEDLISFGTAVMFVGQRRNGTLLFQARHLAECVIAENDEGDIDTVYRCYEATVRELVQQFGIKTVSDEVRKAFEDRKYERKFDVIHVVAPRSDRDPGKRDAKNMAFMSCYFERKSKNILEETGFPEFPYVVPRWSKRPGEIYGRSPAMTALADIKMLNEMMKTTLKAAQKATDPPLFLPDDAFMGPLRVVPGGLNFYRGNREIIPMPTPDKLPITLEIMEEVRNRIRNTFNVDLLQMFTDHDMTLGEAQMRQSERMRILGPILGRLNGELLERLVERVYGILSRAKMLPEVPQELDSVPVSVDFVSPIAVAQRQVEAAGFMQMMQMAMPILQVDPGAFGRVFSSDRSLEVLADVFRVNPKILTTDEEKEAAAQQAQAMQAAQMGPPLAKTALDGAKATQALGATQAEGGMDLAALLQGAGAQMRENPELAASVRDSAGEVIPEEALDQDVSDEFEDIGA